ncbi:MAG: aminotransferase class III-fold pyridoxal phosphate-dependent enzyme [Gemmatimonadota bacterium]
MSDTTKWSTILSDAWGIDATLEQLAGEYDLNFRASASDGRNYVLKVMRTGCDPAFVDLLCAAHEHVRLRTREQGTEDVADTSDARLPVAELVPTRDAARWWLHRDEELGERIVWLLTMLDGVEYARLRAHPIPLVAELGTTVARLDTAMADLAHPGLRRDFKWDLRHAEWIGAHLGTLDHDRRGLIGDILSRYLALQPALLAEPCAVVHNDLNDWNILVAPDTSGVPRISGILDFGDIVHGPLVAEIAIAGAYLVLDHPTPERALAAFVGAYHQVTPLTGAQLDLLWSLLLMRLAVSVINSAQMARERPGDPYVVVSQAPAWRFLERFARFPEAVMRARLRAACALPASDAAGRVIAWLDRERGSFSRVMGVALDTLPIGSLSITTSTVPQDPMRMSVEEARTVGAAAGVGPAWVGSYGEPRAVYTAPAFRLGADATSDRRSVHIGVDIFLPAGTPVHAPFDGVIDTVEYRDAPLDYGGMVVLRHETPDGDPFWTLYGHLARAQVEKLAVGDAMTAGNTFATLGTAEENGGWDPHLHMQLATTTDGMGHDWPGVAAPDDLPLWRAICPNPAALLNLPDAVVAYQPIDHEALLAGRRAHFATNLRLSYRDPCLFVRGWKHYLFDEWGRVFLDAYNNVPHVGHAHPRLRRVAHDQLARLNTNTRYLHPAQLQFAEALLRRMPPHLTHVFLVNSGSEANELALRLARASSGGRDMVTPEHGYHGHTTGAYDISAYKFDKPGGGGRPDWVQLVPVADSYRGPHRGERAGEQYATYVDDAIARIAARGGRLAGFIAETFPSVGGQVIPPVGYLQGVYARIRASGGVCIADEVQTGLGRLGEYFWGFEQQQVLPDIVVLGKPLGNGHPIGALVTTTAVARTFDNGIEFFSTFGGSTLSCRVGTEVLQIVEDEALAANARIVGDALLAGLRELQSRHPLIGDVRGMGLFLGVDLVRDRDARTPATAAARQVVNRMREQRILIGTEGPADNILKIRPPLTITLEDAALLVRTLGDTLAELA